MSKQTRPSLLIALLGGRIQPAALAARQLEPEAIACIASRDTPARVGELQRLVEKQLTTTRWVDGCTVDPYDQTATQRALDEIIERANRDSVALSLASGTLPMSVAAVDVARRLDIAAYYVNTQAGSLIDLAHPRRTAPLTINISVADYLSTYGFDVRPDQDLSSERSRRKSHLEALAALTADITSTNRLLPWIGASQGTAKPFVRRWTLPRRAWSLFETLCDLGLVELLDEASGKRDETIRFRIGDSIDGKFLGGDWLEQAVYVQAGTIGTVAEGGFDSCAYGVHFLADGKAERELDFLGTRGGSLLAASCKTFRPGKPWKKQWLDELVTVTRELGGDYCIRIFVTSHRRPAPGRNAGSYENFTAQAHQAKVVVVTGDDLPELATILRRELIRPTYAFR